jgi:hypothetical protein
MPTSAFAVQAGLKKPQNPGDMFNLCAPFSNRIKMVKLVLTPQPALKTKNEKAGSRLADGTPAFTTKEFKTILSPIIPLEQTWETPVATFPMDQT